MSAIRRNSLGDCRGFTLLELLVASAIGAMILLVINATYFGALRLHNTTNAQADRELIVQRALGLVQRDLSGVMVPTGPLSGQFQDTPSQSLTQDFTNTRISPDLYTTSAAVDGWSPFSEVQLVTYFLAPSTDGSNTKSLVRAVTRNLLPAQTPTTDERTLMTGIHDAQFDYYDGTEWTDTWDSTATFTLPAMIRFTLTLESGQPNQPPPAPIQLLVPVVVMTKTSQSLAAQAQATEGSAL